MAHNGRHHCAANQGKAKEYRRKRYKELLIEKKLAKIERVRTLKKRWSEDLVYQARQQKYYATFAPSNNYFQEKYDKHIKRYGELK